MCACPTRCYLGSLEPEVPAATTNLRAGQRLPAVPHHMQAHQELLEKQNKQLENGPFLAHTPFQVCRALGFCVWFYFRALHLGALGPPATWEGMWQRAPDSKRQLSTPGEQPAPLAATRIDLGPRSWWHGAFRANSSQPWAGGPWVGGGRGLAVCLHSGAILLRIELLFFLALTSRT